VFNIWYNVTNIQPLLSEDQLARFMRGVTAYNVLTYPALILFYVKWMLPVRQTFHRLSVGDSVAEDRLEQDQRKVINSPWAIVTIGCIGWFLCIPAFLLVMYAGSEPVHPHVLIHLPISFLIAGMIAVSQSLFISEVCSLRLLHPVFFPNGGASSVEGAHSMTISRKGLVWAVSVIVCPVVSLLMLIVAPRNVEWIILFAMSVSLVTISFGLASAWLMAQLVTEPVKQLRHAAERVGDGDLDVIVKLSRADDFGPLIDEFNRMVGGLKERARIQETFGRHVGEAAAKEILSHSMGQTGVQKDITVMFVDLRNFTALSSQLPPGEVVSVLNLFLTEMVEIVEHEGGMVNKFLGDGFMALFGAIGNDTTHPDSAVAAGTKIVAAMTRINELFRSNERDDVSEVQLSIGVGIHTGPAIVGSVGSPKRLEYTAIGDTVNVASRIESLTKPMGVPLLFSASTRSQLNGKMGCRELPAQNVKGKAEPVEIFTTE
jgi:adenylate cyclase